MDIPFALQEPEISDANTFSMASTYDNRDAALLPGLTLEKSMEVF
jgi:hypothetical protein